MPKCLAGSGTDDEPEIDADLGTLIPRATTIQRATRIRGALHLVIRRRGADKISLVFSAQIDTAWFANDHPVIHRVVLVFRVNERPAASA